MTALHFWSIAKMAQLIAAQCRIRIAGAVRHLQIVSLILAGTLASCGPSPSKTTPTAITLPRLVQSDATFPELEQAHAQHRSHVWVEGAGTVTRLMRDDTKRPRHQRFVVKIGSGVNAFTVMIAHNIDLASRVPLKKGDQITFRGEYIWSEQGGTVHWTHDDPQHKGENGWIRWKDFVYR
jgi:hypothetical protein